MIPAVTNGRFLSIIERRPLSSPVKIGGMKLAIVSNIADKE